TDKLHSNAIGKDVGCTEKLLVRKRVLNGQYQTSCHLSRGLLHRFARVKEKAG
ncbi:hypothetical protein J6590_095870, partial [Homalodisca vitripennis]